MFNEQRIGQLADLLLKYFFNRKDKISVQGYENPCPARPAVDLRTILRAHVGGPDYCEACVGLLTTNGEIPYTGPMRIGTFFPGVDEYVKLACIDFDDHDNENSLVSPAEAALKTASVLEKHGLKPHLEVSGGGKGQHLWVFFEEKLPAIDVKEILLNLIPTDLELENGQNADPKRNRGVEVFPKTVHLGKNGVGSPVWLPFWKGATGHGNHFWRYDSKSRKGKFYIPDSFETSVFPELLLKEVVESRRKKNSSVNTKGYDKSVFKKWERDVLAVLDLNKIYGPWLTGRLSSKPGYLECRCPWSTTGGQHPSASLQTGENGTRKGVLYSFILDQSFSVFDFLYLGPNAPCKTYEEACYWFGERTGIPWPGNLRRLKRHG